MEQPRLFRGSCKRRRCNRAVFVSRQFHHKWLKSFRVALMQDLNIATINHRVRIRVSGTYWGSVPHNSLTTVQRKQLLFASLQRNLTFVTRSNKVVWMHVNWLSVANFWLSHWITFHLPGRPDPWLQSSTGA